MLVPPSLVITTGRRPNEALHQRAQWFAVELGVPLVPRTGSLAELCREHDVSGVLVVRERVTYEEPATGLQYFYHPAMVKVRLHSHKRGDRDPMVEAMELQPGESVLDCTLGRASDAVLCSWVVGPSGRVVGLEASPILAALTRDAILHHSDPSRDLTAALRRIEGHCADHREFLAACPDRSFTVVYFDPLFHEPLLQSQAMAPLRALADPSPLSSEAVRDACRVASRYVVIKQRRGTPLWMTLPLTRLVKARKSRVEYGLIAV